MWKLTGNQCKDFKTRVMCSLLLVLISTRAAEFCFSMFLSLLTCFLLWTNVFLLWSLCNLSCLGCWPPSRSSHSLKMTTGLQGRVDAARWPSEQGRASLSRAETGACSVICQTYYCGVRHVVMPTVYCSHGSSRPPQSRQVPAS